MIKVPMTMEGAERLRAELNQLKNVERRKNSAAIGEARAHGDLRENAEYHAAKERQSFIEGRIHDIESKLSHAQIIDVKTMSNDGKVIFGATVCLVNLGSQEEVRYQIVGLDEADVKQQKISVTSPIARALVGKMEGDVVTVQAPTGAIEYEITQVEYI